MIYTLGATNLDTKLTKTETKIEELITYTVTCYSDKFDQIFASYSFKNKIFFAIMIR